MLFSEMRLKLFKGIRSKCDRQLFSSVDIVKYGYANSISTLVLSFFECMSSSTVDIDRLPIFFWYEPTDMVEIDQFLGTWTELTVDIDLDQPTGRLNPTDRIDDTCESTCVCMRAVIIDFGKKK